MPNKEYKNTKRTLITAIAILIVAVFALSTTAVLLKHFCSQPKNNNHVATIQSERYDFRKAEKLEDGRYRISNEDYETYNQYSIYDLDALKIFAQIVNTDNCESSKVYKSFENKTVYLEANIDCGGAEISIGKCYYFVIGHKNKIFKGSFDGQYHTISNFHSDNYYHAIYHRVGDYTSFMVGYYGFFTYASGTIENLRLSNFKINSVSGTFNSKLSHLIVGLGYSATIQNCAVENVSGSVSSTHSCSGFSSTEENTLKSCYFDLTGTSISPGFISDSRATGNVVKGVSDGGCSQDYKNTAVKGEWVGLSKSSEGGSNDISYWYYGGEDYNDGWLYPRKFIKDWKPVRFVATNGKINGPTDIEIPADGDPVACPATSSISIYNRTIGSATTLCHYNGVQWSYQNATFYVNVGGVDTFVSGYQYRVTYSPRKINVTINIKKDGEVLSGKEYKDVDCGHKISVTYTGDANKARSITINDYTYTPEEKYYISNAEEIKKITKYHHNTQPIEITVKLKKYDISIS